MAKPRRRRRKNDVATDVDIIFSGKDTCNLCGAKTQLLTEFNNCQVCDNCLPLWQKYPDLSYKQIMRGVPINKVREQFGVMYA